MDIDQLFGPGGALSAADPRYESRLEQEQMAEAVAQALEQNHNLVVEAGTGVGKSLAYLLPGALWAVTHGRRLLVSTYTRALQEQILEKELPVVAQAMSRLGHTLRYAMLQGADNYLCVQRLSRLEASPELLADGQTRTINELTRWAATASTGHRSSLPCLVPQGLWSRIARDPDLCLGPGGKFWSACLFRKDRERAERAHILVVNHALLLSGARLPSYDALIIDEAHNLEETAISHFGTSVSEGRVARLLEDAHAFAKDFPELGRIAARCGQEAAVFFKELAKEHGFAEGGEPGGKLLGQSSAAEPPAFLDLEKALLALASMPDLEKDEMELRLLHGRVSALRGDIQSILGGDSEDVARWIEWGSRSIDLKAAPLEVGQRLAEGLFSRGVPIVLTSATLSSGNGLKEFKANLGFEGARELVLDSPFDYQTQAGLLLLDDLPEPSEDKKYISAVSARCREIIDRVPGGLFILFSSWKMLRSIHEKLKRKIKDRPLWIQGTAGSEALLEDFAAAGNAVLLGVETFWQGVDVPGEALSCVVLVKLPFPNFGSPVEEARRRWFESMGRGYFDGYSLPRAVMKFRQGFGRLIRASTDRGAVVVLDPRILHRGYGNAFLEALPRCRRLESIEDLGAFFKEGVPQN